jgi:hypothetical protein
MQYGGLYVPKSAVFRTDMCCLITSDKVQYAYIFSLYLTCVSPVVFSGVYNKTNENVLVSFLLCSNRSFILSWCIIRLEMNVVREGLDRSNRKHKRALNASPLQRRIQFERSLSPSAATLIICPLALLEHWYEQISRHLNLQYFCSSNDRSGDNEEDGEEKEETGGEGENMDKRSRCRGVVYLDGLGDIVDVDAPLSRLRMDSSTRHHSAESVQMLSRYLIVVTTFERCAAEFQRVQDSLGSLSEQFEAGGTSSSSSSGRSRSAASTSASVGGNVSSGATTASRGNSLLQMRWLRVVVDEGHELGKGAGAGVGEGARRKKKKQQQRPPTGGAGAGEGADLAGGGAGAGAGDVVTVNPAVAAAAVAAALAASAAATAAENARNTALRVTQFVSMIAAERRWVMSGTPTTGANNLDALRQLYKLLLFLRHPCIITQPTMQRSVKQTLPSSASAGSLTSLASSSENVGAFASPLKIKVEAVLLANGEDTEEKTIPVSNVIEEGADFISEKAWEKNIVQPCLAQQEVAWKTVTDILRSIMLRHTKVRLFFFVSFFPVVTCYV